MIKDLSASLVAAAAAINTKTRKAYVAEQAAIQAKKIAKMPQQPAPKADPAAVSSAKKMAEAVMIDEKLTDDAKKKIQTALGPKGSQMRQTSGSARAIIGLAKTNPANTVKKEEVELNNEAAEGSVPKTPREKELAAKHGHPKRITFGDVLKARGVKMKEEVESVEEAAGWNPIKHIPKEKQTDAIKTAAKDVKRGSYADRAALLRAGGVQKEELIGNQHKLDKNKNNKIDKHDFELLRKERDVKVEGFMDTMKKFGKKVVDTVTHGDDVDMIKDLQKKVGVPQTGVKPKAAKPVDTKPKMAHDYVKEEKEESAAHEKAEKKPWPSAKGPSSLMDKEKSAFTSKKVSTGTIYSRKPVKEEIDECLEVHHEQFGAGKTLGQFSEDLSEVDVMFAEGIKRVSIDDIEMVEETAAIHPSAIHVSPSSNGKYKVHAVGKKFASGIKVGEHLTDTHLDDFSEMGGKIKMVKAPKKA